MLSVNFKIEDNAIIGIDAEYFHEFMIYFAKTHKNGKLYVLKVVEQTSSQKIQNYYHVFTKSFADHIGLNKDSVVDFLNEYIVKSIDERTHHDLDSSFLKEDITDLNTGEIVDSKKIKSLHSMTNTQIMTILDIASIIFTDYSKDWTKPNPELYKIEVKSKSNKIEFPNKKIIL